MFTALVGFGLGYVVGKVGVMGALAYLRAKWATVSNK